MPPARFTQEQTYALLGYRKESVRQIFLNSDIESRHFWIDPQTFTPTETADQLHARYLEGAMHLGCLAAKNALARAGLAPHQVDCILVASCTGYVCPDISTRLVQHLQLRDDVQRGALLGHGCAGALPLLQRAHDHACAYPGHRVLAIAVEICSATYFVDHTLETVIGNAICADGAAAVVLSTDEAERDAGQRGPRLIGFQSVLDPSHLDKVGFERRDSRMRIVLAAEIRDLAGPIIEKCLSRLLAPHGLTRQDVGHWVLHPGGRKVLDRVAEYLGIAEKQLRFSRHVLRNFGNMSAPTALFVLDEIARNAPPAAGDYGVLLALGPGFAAEAALLQW